MTHDNRSRHDAEAEPKQSPPPTKADHFDLDQLGEEFSKAIREGKYPHIDAYTKRYPDNADEIRELLESISLIETFKQSKSAVSDASARQPAFRELDDYKIIREIGRGGMGIVFEAIHEPLGRKVAIKVLANNLLGESKHLVRFRREARAAAKLRHTNIVPVFGVGTSGEHHYYVMDYIDGLSLHQWLTSLDKDLSPAAPTVDAESANTFTGINTNKRFDTDTLRQPGVDASLVKDTSAYQRWVANLGVSASDALHYAHSQGVLHRDIKPANLLLDRHNTLWIADFGLAKLAEQNAVTATGDIVGTPQYMPPESFEGNYDVRSEVYALGLTLYELLTLRPAIEGNGTADIIRKATRGVAVHPRKVNPKIAPDLETILLKALSHDPEDRYSSAEMLRDDLTCFLADLPIAARKTNPVERMIRWSRREPKVAALTTATFALLLALAGVSAFGFWQTKKNLHQAQASEQSSIQSLALETTARNDADKQRLLAEKNLQVAVKALNEVMENISRRGIETGAEFLAEVTDTTSPNVSAEDAELLNSLLGFFDELGRNNSKDLLAESAIAAKYAGDISMRFGDLQRAEAAFNESLKRTRELAACDPDETAHVIAQAAILNELALITGLRGRLKHADNIFFRTKSLLQSCPDVMATDEGRFQYAIAHRLVASHATRIGLDEPNPNQGGGRLSLSRRFRLTDPKPGIQRARTVLQESIDVLTKLTSEHPEDQQYKVELARAYRDKAVTASLARHRTEAEQSIQSSIALFRELLAANPTLDAIRYELALTLCNTETFNMDYLRRSVEAHELCMQLLKTSPDLPHVKALYASIRTTFAERQMRINKYKAAEDTWKEVLQIYESLIKTSPNVLLYERRHSDTLESLAELKVRQGEREAARNYLEQAIEGLQIAIKRSPNSPVIRMQLNRLIQRARRQANAEKATEPVPETGK
ncbi:protein kinase [Rhodopirellula sp.]|nr:protein kinase [Rhodopirellula sp.]